ncbi:MAG: hypothetical protein WC325_12405 [Candidatus Bathyarchaeia archaeon]|jgi:hypothetical protein
MTSINSIKREVEILHKALFLKGDNDWRQEAEYTNSLLRCYDALIETGKEETEETKQEVTDAFTAHSKFDDGIYGIYVREKENSPSV